MLIHQPNDKLFKNSMADIRVARDFFETNLPAALLGRVDLDTLVLEKHSFIDELYKATEADLVYHVKINESVAYFYLLCENQSEVDSYMAFRLLVYTVRLIELHRKRYPDGTLPLVYPMVVYSGKKQWDAPLEIFDLFGDQAALAKEVLFKPYQLIDLQRITNETLREHPWSGLFQYALKYRKLTDFKRFLEDLIPWLNELVVLGGKQYALTVLSYAVEGIETGDEQLLLEKSQALSEELRGEVMTIAQQLEQKGLEKGLKKGKAEGKAEGKQEGEAVMLLRFIELKFKQVPAELKNKIQHMDAETLLEFSAKVLEAQSLDELLKM